MERVPTTKQELADIMKKYKGHVIATSACLGGELSSLAYDMSIAEKKNDIGNGFWENIGFSDRTDLVYRNKNIHALDRIDT